MINLESPNEKQFMADYLRAGEADLRGEFERKSLELKGSSFSKHQNNWTGGMSEETKEENIVSNDPSHNDYPDKSHASPSSTP